MYKILHSREKTEKSQTPMYQRFALFANFRECFIMLFIKE